MTLDDFERRNTLYFAFFHLIRQIFRPIISQWLKIDLSVKYSLLTCDLSSPVVAKPIEICLLEMTTASQSLSRRLTVCVIRSHFASAFDCRCCWQRHLPYRLQILLRSTCRLCGSWSAADRIHRLASLCNISKTWALTCPGAI